jgi:hypothetical protein
MMATTIISSMSVKPLRLRRVFLMGFEHLYSCPSRPRSTPGGTLDVPASAAE